MGDKISSFIDRHLHWIETNMTDGGWPDQPGKRPSVLTTAEAVTALLEAPDGRESSFVNKGITFLIDHQVKEGSDCGAWKRENTDRPHEQIADLLRTSKAISAIARASARCKDESKKRSWKASCGQGVEWLKQRQLPGGEWSFRAGDAADALATCFALSALFDANAAFGFDIGCPKKPAVWFDHRVDSEGALGGPQTESALRPVVTTELLHLHLTATKLGVGDVLSPETEKQALKWVLKQKPEVFVPVETKIELDPHNPANNYPYTVMLNTTIMNLFAMRAPTTWYGRWFAPLSSRRLRRLALYALRKVQSLQDNHGGFKQPRVFTWATCMIVIGISRCRGPLKRMPSTRDPKDWAEIPLAFFVIVHGFCFVLERLDENLRNNSAFTTVSIVSLVAANALAVLVGYMERGSILDGFKRLRLRVKS